MEIYLGAYGGGLNRLSYSAKDNLEFTHYTLENGLPNDAVSQIREDFEGNIWSMHIRQISKLNPCTGEIIYFEKKDGFNAGQFMGNTMKFTSSGTMICGGVEGFTFFKPNNVTVNDKNSQITITNFKLFNKSIKTNEEVNGRSSHTYKWYK